MANTLYLWNTYLNKVRYIVGNAIQNILSTYNRPNKMLRSTFHDKKKFEGIWEWIIQTVELFNKKGLRYVLH